MKKPYVKPELEIVELKPEEQLMGCYRSNKDQVGGIVFGLKCTDNSGPKIWNHART